MSGEAKRELWWRPKGGKDRPHMERRGSGRERHLLIRTEEVRSGGSVQAGGRPSGGTWVRAGGRGGTWGGRCGQTAAGPRDSSFAGQSRGMTSLWEAFRGGKGIKEGQEKRGREPGEGKEQEKREGRRREKQRKAQERRNVPFS